MEVIDDVFIQMKEQQKKQVKEIFNKPEGTQNIKINKCVFSFPPNGPILDQSEKE